MSVLRDLDKKFHSLVGSMRHNSRSYSAIMKQRRAAADDVLVIGADRDARGALTGYRSEYQAAVEQSNRKLDASQRVLDQFSTHFSRLQRALEKFEEDEGSRASPSSTMGGGSRKRRRTVAAMMDDDGDGSPVPRRYQSRKSDLEMTGNGTSVAAVGAPDVAVGGGAEDEEIYCTCRQVSYGSMVGCDNPQCAIEWFHYACVGLVAQPKGAWFCPTCIGAGFGGGGSSLPTASAAVDDQIIDVEGDDADVKTEGQRYSKADGTTARRRKKTQEAR